MKCRNVQKKFIFLPDNELPSEEMASIRNHIHSCKHCEEVYETLCNALSVIDSEKTVTVNPFFVTRVEQHLSNKLHQSRSRAWAIGFPVNATLIPVVFSLFLAIMVSISLLFRLSDKSTQLTGGATEETSNYFQEIIYQDIYANSIESIILTNGDNN